MKKILWMQFLAVFLFLSLAVGQQAEQAELTNFSGHVEILLEGAADYVPAQEGMMFESGDKIKTGGDSLAEVSFNEENTNLVRVNENSDLKITFSGDEKLEMNQGEIFTTISNLPSGSAFEIRTPTAVSGARGTDWVTKVTEEGTDVEAMDSTPYVRHFQEDGILSKEQTFIAPGKMTSVQKFHRPMAAREIPLARQQQWQAVKHDVRKRGSEALIKRQQRPAFDRKEFLDKHRGRGQGKGRPMLDSERQKQMREGAEGHKPMLDSKDENFDRQEGPDARRPMMGREGERFDKRNPNRMEPGDRQQKRFIEGDQARQGQGLNDRPFLPGHDLKRPMRQPENAGGLEGKPKPPLDGTGRLIDERLQKKRSLGNEGSAVPGARLQGSRADNTNPQEGRKPPMKREGLGLGRKSPAGMQRR